MLLPCGFKPGSLALNILHLREGQASAGILFGMTLATGSGACRFASSFEIFMTALITFVMESGLKILDVLLVFALCSHDIVTA